MVLALPSDCAAARESEDTEAAIGIQSRSINQPVLGIGALKPRLIRNPGNPFSILENYTVMSAESQGTIRMVSTYESTVFYNSILDPNRPRAHHACHHHICEEPVSDYSNLAWMLHSGL